MRNYIWMGSISKTPHGKVAWSKVCAPKKEGGLGVGSIRTMNESFLFKLAWEIMTGKDAGLQFIQHRHSTESGEEVRYHISSSIWLGTNRIRAAIKKEICWIPGNNSKLKFWTDNWVGYFIADKVGIPEDDRQDFRQLIKEFRQEEKWVFDPQFAVQFPDICSDVAKIKIASNAEDHMIWPLHLSRELTSKVVYNYY